MEEQEYRRQYQELNPIRCVYEKALLNRCAGCHHAHYFNLAERQGVACQRPTGPQRCEQWLQILRPACRFLLHNLTASQTLPHASELRVQCGGIRALAEVIGDSDDSAPDVDRLLSAASKRYQTLAKIPLEHIVPVISRYSTRRKKHR